jgi:hypothetical protein
MLDGVVIPRPDNLHQTRLDNSLSVSEAKADRMRAARARSERYLNGRSLSWKYDEVETKAAIKSGVLQVDPTRLYSDFLAWMNDASITQLRDMRTGETVRHLAPKRGNKAHAAKYRKKLTDIEIGLNGLELDRPLGRGRDTLWMCRALLITLTFDHKIISMSDAWRTISKEIAKFKIKLKRVMGFHSILTIAVKEGTTSGYPAPHIMVIMDLPVTCKKRYSRFAKKNLYRINNDTLYYGIHDGGPNDKKGMVDCWPHGFIDVQGITNGQILDGKEKVSPASYLFKYLTKAIDITNTDTRKKNLGVSTHAWQKLHRLRPLHICKKLKLYVVARLDRLLHESQHSTGSVWRYDSSIYCPLTEYQIILSQPPPPDPAPWPFLGAGELATRIPVANP